MKARQFVGGVMAVAALSGCGETLAEVPATNVSVDQIFTSAPVSRIQNGESAYVVHISVGSVVGKRLIREIPLIDHLYPNGPEDTMAPKISETPIRTSEQVSLSGGDSPTINNDGACDSYPIEGRPKYIGVVALGGDEKGTMIVWPKDSGFVDVCVFSDMEPGSSDGVVLFTTDAER